MIYPPLVLESRKLEPNDEGTTWRLTITDDRIPVECRAYIETTRKDGVFDKEQLRRLVSGGEAIIRKQQQKNKNAR